MLKIKVGTEYLDMGNFSVTFELLSPIFNDIGSFSYPFTLPATEKNKRILTFPGRVNKHIRNELSFDAEIFLKGILWKYGKLLVDEAGIESYKCHLTIGEGDFYNNLKTINLPSIELGQERFTSDIYNETWKKTYPEVDYAMFPLRDPDFYAEVENDEFKANFASLLAGTLNLFDLSGPNQFNFANNTFVPFPFLNYVVSKIFEHINVPVIENDIFTDDELKKLVLVNTTSINIYEPAGTNIAVTIPPYFYLNDHLPDVSVIELFKFLEKQFLAFVFYIENTSSVRIITFKSIYNSTKINPISDDLIAGKTITSNIFDGYELNYDADADDGIYGDPHTVKIKWRKFKGVVDDIADLPGASHPGDIYYVINTATYYYRKSATAGWYKISLAFSDFATGTKNFALNVPVAMHGYFNSLDPVMLKPGTFFYQQQFESTESFRLMFYRPRLTAAVPYPYATSFHDLDNTNSKSLAWWGENGIYEHFYKEYIALMLNKIICEFLVNFTVTYLRNIKFYEKYRFAEANWLLSKIKFTVMNEKISPATIVAYKV